MRLFWDKLAEFCAGGARLIGADMNMCMFGVIPELLKRKCGVTLISHHYERDQESDYDRLPSEFLYDSVGLWLVGPFNIEKQAL